MDGSTFMPNPFFDPYGQLAAAIDMANFIDVPTPPPATVSGAELYHASPAAFAWTGNAIATPYSADYPGGGEWLPCCEGHASQISPNPYSTPCFAPTAVQGPLLAPYAQGFVPQQAPVAYVSPPPTAQSSNDDQAEMNDESYAKWIAHFLRSAPGHTLTLRQLYDMVDTLTSKTKGGQGWKNSVRHNLSLNGAFERVFVPAGDKTSKEEGAMWRLTDEAVRNGVYPTTRYRGAPKKKSTRQGQPAVNRQRSGAKGGRATRAAARRQQEQIQQQLEHQQIEHQQQASLALPTPVYEQEPPAAFEDAPAVQSAVAGSLNFGETQLGYVDDVNPFQGYDSMIGMPYSDAMFGFPASSATQGSDFELDSDLFTF